MDTPTDNPTVPFQSSFRRRQFLISLLGAFVFGAFLIWLYYPALDSYFANDDWVILYHNSKIPPGEWWRYFNPKTIWFYRPLQSMQFGLTWHLAGLNHRAYSAQLLVMHLVVCWLAWLLLKQLFGRGFAWLAIFLFSVSWIYADILLWKANFNTLQHAITTLLASVTFVHYLQTRAKKWLAATVVAAVMNCFTKESSVSLPLVLAVIWLVQKVQSSAGTAEKPSLYQKYSAWVLQAIRDIGPVITVIIVYVILHRLLIVNVEQHYTPGYQFMGLVTAAKQWTHGINHSLLGFLHDPVLLGQWPALQSFLLKLVRYGHVLPLIFLGVAYWRRSASAAFGVLFCAVVQFPHFLLANYHGSRYYYLSAFGGGVFLAAILWPFLTKLTSDRSQNPDVISRLFGYMAACAFVWIIMSNVVVFQNIIAKDHQESVFMEQAHRYVAGAEQQLPPGSVVVYRNVPSTFMVNGMAATEMLHLLTGREDLLAVAEGEKVTPSKRQKLESRQHHFILDIMTTQPKLLQVRN